MTKHHYNKEQTLAALDRGVPKPFAVDFFVHTQDHCMANSTIVYAFWGKMSTLR